MKPFIIECGDENSVCSYQYCHQCLVNNIPKEFIQSSIKVFGTAFIVLMHKELIPIKLNRFGNDILLMKETKEKSSFTSLERLFITKTLKVLIEEKDESYECEKTYSYLENNRLYELEMEIRKELSYQGVKTY